MHVLTLVANSTLLICIRRNYRTVLRAGIAGMVLTRQRAIKCSTSCQKRRARGEGGSGVF